MKKQIYRGYEIEPHPPEGVVIKKDGQVVCSQLSEDLAYKWIDRERKKQFAQKTKG